MDAQSCPGATTAATCTPLALFASATSGHRSVANIADPYVPTMFFCVKSSVITSVCAHPPDARITTRSFDPSRGSTSFTKCSREMSRVPSGGAETNGMSSALHPPGVPRCADTSRGLAPNVETASGGDTSPTAPTPPCPRKCTDPPDWMVRAARSMTCTMLSSNCFFGACSPASEEIVPSSFSSFSLFSFSFFPVLVSLSFPLPFLAPFFFLAVPSADW